MSERRASRVVSALLLAAVLGCGPAVPTPTGVVTPPDKDKAGDKDKAKDQRPVAVLTPEQLGKEWKVGDDATARKYSKGLVEVTGPVNSFLVDLSGRRGLIIVCGPDKDAPHLSVVTKVKEPWAAVGVGQVVTVRGELQNAGVPYLMDAELVDPKPSTSVVVKSEELAAEAAKDRKATAEKYKGKSLIVVGEIVDHDEKKTTVFLKGTDKMKVECSVYLTTGDSLAKPLEKGKEAKLCGVILDGDSGEGRMSFVLYNALPILGEK
jgi:hypothetical protein